MGIKTIVFPNRDGILLRGLFHQPDTCLRGSRKDLVVFPNGGLMGCEGDFRAYVRIARHLSENGLYVLRFSPSGLGFSDGIVDECRRNIFFTKIETGLFVDDIQKALDFIRTEMEFDTITIAGICGGAISAFISASQINEVQNVISIGMPTILDNDEVDYNVRMPKEQAILILKTYYSKLFSPFSWWRFIRGKSDWVTLKMIFNKLILRKKTGVNSEDSEKISITNPEFYKASRKILGQKNVLFIYGDTDWIYWEFVKHFADKYYPDKNKRPFDSYLISNGNHMLTWVEMQEDAAKKIYSWLNEKTHQNINLLKD